MSNAGAMIDHAFGKRAGSGGGPVGPGASVAAAAARKKDPVQNAIDEARRQSELQGPYVEGAATLLGALPVAPGLAPAIKLGKMMGDASVDKLQANIGDAHTIPGDPGGVYGRVNGEMYSNRADVPGYNDNLGKTIGSEDPNALEDEETRRKKAAATKIGSGPVSSPTTLLGSPIDSLGAVRAIS